MLFDDKMKKIIHLTAKAFVTLAVLVAFGITVLYATGLSYIYCSLREGSWKKATNERDLESRLFAFYSKNSILPEQSYMGRDHVITSGQRMTRYLIFDKEPLDIVYNEDGSVVGFYVSYE